MSDNKASKEQAFEADYAVLKKEFDGIMAVVRKSSEARAKKMKEELCRFVDYHQDCEMLELQEKLAQHLYSRLS